MSGTSEYLLGIYKMPSILMTDTFLASQDIYEIMSDKSCYAIIQLVNIY